LSDAHDILASDYRGHKARQLNSKWRGRDENDPSVDIAKDCRPVVLKVEPERRPIRPTK
jgi:hypothetical protein